MPFTYGNISMKRLGSCHPDLQRIMEDALALSDVDWSITEGYRSPKRQQKLFQQGLSKIDGTTRLGKHNRRPSMAVDIAIYHPERAMRLRMAYDWKHLAYAAGVITSTARQLYHEGKVSHLVRWGANWDKDGVIVLDQTFQDGPHFELYKPKI